MSGKDLFYFRLKHGLSRAQLGAIIGRHAYYIQSLENNKWGDKIPFEVFTTLMEWARKPEVEQEFPQPPSPIYGLSYPSEMCLNPIPREQCAQLNTAADHPNEIEQFAEIAVPSGIRRRTPKDTRFRYSDKMLSVGDIPSQLLSRTGSRSYKKLVTWLKKV